MRIIGLLVVCVALLVIPTAAAAPVSLADACDYNTPVDQLTILKTRDSGLLSPPVVINPAPSLDDATGVPAAGIAGLYLMSFSIDNTVLHLFYANGATYPYRLRCMQNGFEIARIHTNDDFFDCLVLGYCSR